MHGRGPCINGAKGDLMSDGPSLAGKGSVALLAGLITAAAPAPGTPAPLYVGRLKSFEQIPLEDRIRRLTDEQEIRDLVSVYAHRAAHGVFIADLFTDDGSFINRLPGNPVAEVHGRKDIDLYYANVANSPSRAIPMIHNHIIAVNGDEATGISSIEVRTSGNGQSLIGSGFYSDQYRRANGIWKFVVRDATFFHLVPIQQGWAEPAGE
jgi:hypothetical protein